MMSVESAIERVSTIRAALADPALLAEGASSTGAAASGGTEAPAGEATSAQSASFAAALAQAGIAQAGLSQAEAPASSALGAGALAGALPTGTAGLASPAGLTSPAALTSAGLAGSPGALSGVSGVGAAAGAGIGAGSGNLGARIVAIAESQAGRAEEPLGSNEGRAVAMYRSATKGAIPGAPWCAYFASWVAREAGEPLGAEGQGFGSVAQIWSWAQSVGRAIPNGPGVVPKPGDLIVFGDEHVGIVRSVLPDGKIATVEGNYENKVALNVRSASEPTGYVEMS